MKFSDFMIADEGFGSALKSKLMPYAKDTPILQKLANLKKDSARMRATAYRFKGNFKDAVLEASSILNKVSQVPVKNDKLSELEALINLAVKLIHAIDAAAGMQNGGISTPNAASAVILRVSEIEDAYDEYMK